MDGFENVHGEYKIGKRNVDKKEYCLRFAMERSFVQQMHGLKRSRQK